MQAEFQRYLKKQLTKSTKLRLVDVPQTRLPGTDMKALEANRDYWKSLGAKTGADFIVSGVVDFDVNDKSGYKTEEYVSPADGRTYYRQVLVETTGFVFDIDIAVFNADTGEKVIEDNFRDFKEFDQRNYDEILGLFENLRSHGDAARRHFRARRRRPPRGTCSRNERGVGCGQSELDEPYARRPTPDSRLMEAHLKRTIALLFVVSMLFAPSAFPFGQNKIVYDKFHWNIYHSTHFDIYFYDEEKPALQKVVDMAESAYDDLSRKFNFQISKKIPIIYYATHSAFEQTNVDLNFIPEGVGAFAEPTRNRMVIPIDTTDEKLLQLIQHELTHVFEYEILFQGKLGKEVTSNPPTWLMEGLASFMGRTRTRKDRMVLRDAVVNDQVPAITHAQGGGYFAYRFGHAVFEYIQQKYGWEGLRDFIYEYRNTLGNSVDKALKRAFDVTPDEFDSQFRTWLRKQYLPALVAKGEPQEYGDPFKIAEDVESEEISPVPSPSGDLLAAYRDVQRRRRRRPLQHPRAAAAAAISPAATPVEIRVRRSRRCSPSVRSWDATSRFAPSGDQIALFVEERARPQSAADQCRSPARSSAR